MYFLKSSILTCSLITDSCARAQETENKILHVLQTSQGNILEDNNLRESTLRTGGMPPVTETPYSSGYWGRVYHPKSWEYCANAGCGSQIQVCTKSWMRCLCGLHILLPLRFLNKKLKHSYSHAAPTSLWVMTLEIVALARLSSQSSKNSATSLTSLSLMQAFVYDFL